MQTSDNEKRKQNRVVSSAEIEVIALKEVHRVNLLNTLLENKEKKLIASKSVKVSLILSRAYIQRFLLCNVSLIKLTSYFYRGLNS